MIKLIFAAFLYIGALNAQLTPEEFGAMNAYDAKMYPQTLKFYQQILDSPISPEERSIALYNIGTTYLMTGELAFALRFLQESLEGSHNPLLIQYAKMNLALTRARQVEELMTKEEFDSNLGLDWIQSAEYYLQEAQIASCKEAKKEGYETCPKNSDIQKLKEVLAQLRTQIPPSTKQHSVIPSLAFLQSALYAWELEQSSIADSLLKSALKDANAKWVGYENSNDPIELLKELIYHQRELQHLGMQMRSLNGLPDEFVKGMIPIQMNINSMAEQFYTQVYKIQSDLFHLPSPIGNPDQRISKRPWDGAIPLFDQGLMDSFKAYDLLKANKLVQANHREETSATFWEQALAYLLNPPNASEAPKPEEGKPQEQPKPEDNNQQPQEQQKESVDEIMTHLQEMDVEANPSGEQKALQTEGLPW